jgi:hypothetical protein
MVRYAQYQQATASITRAAKRSGVGCMQCWVAIWPQCNMLTL